MNAGMGISHKGRAVLGARCYRDESLIIKTMDRVMEVLNIGTTDTVYGPHIPLRQAVGESIGYSYRSRGGCRVGLVWHCLHAAALQRIIAAAA